MKQFFALFFIPLLICGQSSLIQSSVSGNSYKLELSAEFNQYAIEKSSAGNIIHFDGFVDESKPGEFTLPRREVFIAVPPGADPAVSVSVLKTTKLKGLPGVNPKVGFNDKREVDYANEKLRRYIPEPLFRKRGYLWIGNNYCLHLTLSLFVPNLTIRETVKNEKFQIELRFKNIPSESPELAANFAEVSELILNKKFASKYRAKPDFTISATDNWFNYTDTFVKIAVGEDGIQRVYGSDLENAGISLSGIQTDNLKLFNRGEEIPIFVVDNGDGQFDGTDYLEFPATRNYTGKHRELNNYGTPYNEFLNRYTDSTIYWITWTQGAGKRIPLRSSPTFTSTDTVQFYDYFEHFEKNPWFDYAIQDIVRRQDPEWLENETWNWWVQGVGISEKRFTVDNIFPNRPAKVFVKMQGYVGDVYVNTYDLGISINNDTTIYSRGFMSRYGQKLLSAEFNSSKLNEGGNKIVVHSFQTAASINLTWGDWYEVEIPRKLTAPSNKLNFTYSSLGNDSNVVIKISGLTDSTFNLYKGLGANSVRIKDYTTSNGIFAFKDKIANGDKFFLATSSTIVKPKIYYAKKFQNLRDSRNLADYLIITHPKLINASSAYADFISQNYGVKTKLISIPDIFDEYAYGYPEPEAIKEFLKSTRKYWQSPPPKNVFLIGEANYDYKGYVTERGVPPVENLVPAFGVSSSDPWFTVWDTTGAYIQQMNIGRISAANEEQVYYYLNKHKSYLERPYDKVNKNYLLFSGGKGDNQSEINLLKNSNDFVESLLQVRPTGGRPIHLYKTYEPKSDFGPYSEDFISDAISGGSLFISYLGHSGVQIWDNSIVSPSQLRNDAGISPLITDFGCSTGKFAEPELNSFAELFVLDPSGQAINYAGNASLGFISSATTFPAVFYPALMSDSTHNIGEAHKRGKYKLMETYGSYGVYKIFALCNVLMGDPIVNLKVPQKPNLKAQNSGFTIRTENYSDQTDSVETVFKYHNYGLAPADTFKISIEHYYLSEKVSEKVVSNVIPIYEDSVKYFIRTKNRAGRHEIKIHFDPGNQIDEIYEDDNDSELEIVVPSLSFKTMGTTNFANPALNGITVLNSTSAGSSSGFLQAELDTMSDFSTAKIWDVAIDTFITRINFNNILQDRRYYFRVKDKTPGSDYSTVISFLNKSGADYLLSDNASFSTLLKTSNLELTGDRLQLENKKYVFELFSAGYNDGRTALIRLNGTNYVDQSDNTGHHVVVFDRESLKFESYKVFNTLFGGAAEVQSYITHLDSLDNTKLVAIAISDEGSGNLSAELRNKIKEFGSVLIDSVGWRSSWAMIGYRGAPAGSITEDWHPAFGGIVEIDTTVIKKKTAGYFESELIGPASEWENVILKGAADSGSSVSFKVTGYDSEQNIVGLDSSKTFNVPMSLPQSEFKNAEKLKITGELNASSTGVSPFLDELGVNLKGLPELATNYQVVKLSADTVEQGLPVDFEFYVYNAGEADADSFAVNVDRILSDGQKAQVFLDQNISIAAGGRKKFSFIYDTSPNSGEITFLINIDSDEKITEYFEDNNFYSIDLFAAKDTAVPSISLAFNGRDIYDGEYISAQPEIKIELNDASPLPLTGADKVGILLNDQPPDSGDVVYSYSSGNPKITAVFTPKLTDGEYRLKVFGYDASNNPSDTLARSFMVSNEVDVLNLYNYPNPFADETYFTFKLTQVPDELSIKIYTIAGRLIKQIDLNSGELKHDFNKIFWDGRDEDGDLIANGVYIYKLILKTDGKTKSLSQKLAVVK